MKRTTLALCGGMALMAGCDAVDNALLIRGVLTPGTGCSVEAGDTYQNNLVLDTANYRTMALPLSVDNTLSVVPLNIGTMAAALDTQNNNSITPLRMELRWECDSNGFSSDLGALVLPAFNLRDPFCLDRRDDTQTFVGFDFAQAEGSAIPPEEDGVAVVRAIPQQLGDAFDDLFTIAEYADRCCRESTGCDGQATSMTSRCSELQARFSALDPTGRFGLSVQSSQAGQASRDLTRFRPFAIFSGDYWQQFETNPPRVGATYPMRLRGFLEGVTPDGQTQVSNEAAIGIEVCKNCGLYNGSNREATSYPYLDCLAEL
jgi:hypothetical protein